MINITDPKDCCGCTACSSVCPRDAISMKPDSFGFLYPIVDESKCIECGLCNKVCKFNDDYDISLNFSVPKVYAARHKEINEVLKSRSGAAFVALSDFILDQGGVVYGAGYSDYFQVCHKRAITAAQRDEFRCSKYVQSDMRGVFRMVKEDLRTGRIVLFSGTPCQTSGLHSFLDKREREMLYLIDIVCHGAPSPFFWKDYLDYIENKNCIKIKTVNFRDKEKYGWSDHKETFISTDGVSITSCLFTQLFYKHILFRKSCGNCHYTNLRRPSDITLADFWGWEKSVPNMNTDDKGISLILLNTKKGEQLFNNAKQSMLIEELTVEDCLQSRFQLAASLHPQRNVFEKDYAAHGFDYVLKKYITPNILQKVINKIKYGRSTI